MKVHEYQAKELLAQFGAPIPRHVVVTTAEEAEKKASWIIRFSIFNPYAVIVMALFIIVLGYVCLYRVFASPLVLLGLGMSRLFARFPKPKRMTNYALLIEALTLVFMVLMLFLPFHFQNA